MAFITNPKAKQGQAGQTQGGMISEGAGVAGTGPASQMGAAQPTAAGTGSNWTNIQDFFGAHKGRESSMGQRIAQTGQNVLDRSKQQMGSVQAAGEAAAKPTVTAFDPSQLGQGGMSAQNIHGALTQGGQAGPDYNQFAINNETKDIFNQLDSGNVGSLVDFQVQQGAAPAGTYTGGMRRFDTALLGQDKPFIDSFAPAMQGQFQSEVINPMAAWRADQQAEAERLKGDAGVEAGKWQGGIQEFLGGKQEAIAAELAKQKAADAALQKSIQDNQFAHLPDWAGKDYDKYGRKIGEGDQYFMDDLRKYQSLTGQAPSEQTAAYGALGEGGISRFNELAGLFGDGAPGLITGQAYDPRSVSFDQAAFTSDLARIRAEDARVDAQRQAAADEAARQAAREDQERALAAEAERKRREAEQVLGPFAAVPKSTDDPRVGPSPELGSGMAAPASSAFENYFGYVGR